MIYQSTSSNMAWSHHIITQHSHCWLHPAVTVFPLASPPLCFYQRTKQRGRLEKWLKKGMNTEKSGAFPARLHHPSMCLRVTHFLFGHPVSYCCLTAACSFVFSSVSKSTRNENTASVAQIQVSLQASALQSSEVIDATNTGHIKAKYFFSLSLH